MSSFVSMKPTLTVSLQLPQDIKYLIEFEEQHPVSLRWGLSLKLDNYLSLDSKYFYYYDGEELVGEAILGWENYKSVNVDSITILPTYQGKGYGLVILQHIIDWCSDSNFKVIKAAARQPKSSGMFLKAGFKKVGTHFNWGETNEDYLDVEYKIN